MSETGGQATPPPQGQQRGSQAARDQPSVLASAYRDLRTLLDSLREAIFTLDGEGRVQLFNAAASRVFAIPAEEWPEMPVDLLHADLKSAAEFEERSATALERDGLAEGEIDMRRRGGETFPAEVTVLLLREAEGRESGRILVVRDISHRRHNELQIRKRTRQLAILHEIGVLLSRSLVKEETLPAAMDRLAELLRCDLSGFYEVTELDGKQILRPTGALVTASHHDLRQDDRPEYRSAASRDVIFVENLQHGRLHAPLLQEMGIRSAAYIPIESHGEVMGVLCLGRRDAAPFSGEDVDLFLPLAQIIATALENISLVSGLTHLNEQLLALHELSVRLAQNISEQGAIRDTLETLSHHLKSRIAVFYSPDTVTAALVPRCSVGLTKSHRERVFSSISLPTAGIAPQHPSTRAFLSGMLVESCLEDESPDRLLRLLRRLGLDSLAAAPVQVQGKPLGVATFYFAGKRSLSKNEHRLAQVALRQAGAALANARLFNDLEKNRRILARLSSRILSAQEEERQHLSRELHDGIGQTLSALKLGLEVMGNSRSRMPPEMARDFDRTLDIVIESIAELRRISHDLRPPLLDDLGLMPTIRWFAQRFEEQAGIPVSIVETGRAPALSPQQDANLYRIVQEGLTNISKHACASRARIELRWEPDRIFMCISDDGSGLDTGRIAAAEPGGGLGLAGIKERVHLLGGQFVVQSRAGRGTCLDIDIPARSIAADEAGPSRPESIEPPDAARIPS